ncbi:hypothetical protein [Rhodococcus koreensis]
MVTNGTPYLQRTVGTASELAALPEQAVIRCMTAPWEGTIYTHEGDGRFFQMGGFAARADELAGNEWLLIWEPITL